MEGVKIYKHGGGLDLPMDLLLLADPSEEMVLGYINESELILCEYRGQVIACCALFPHDQMLIEIKNLAVKEEYQGKGIGSLLINDAIQRSKNFGYQKLRICTGNSSLGQRKLYKKLGFTEKEVILNFFLDHYQEPIFENGMECLDLIVLEKELL